MHEYRSGYRLFPMVRKYTSGIRVIIGDLLNLVIPEERKLCVLTTTSIEPHIWRAVLSSPSP